MLSILFSGALQGVDALPVHVEVNAGEPGEPGATIVGLPGSAVKESKDRVLPAIGNSGFHRPMKRVMINLAPGNLRKDGPLYDLPIALAILSATQQLKADCIEEYLIAGELGLSGETRPVRGGLALATLAKRLGLRGVIVPYRTAREAALVSDIDVFPVSSLHEACCFLQGSIPIDPLPSGLDEEDLPAPAESLHDFAEIKGQHALRRAVEVAVAGAHNILIIGPPGSGKSMIAKRIPTIMPRLLKEEFLEILRIYSASGKTLEDGGLLPVRPFRSPHHTISDVGLIGGGSIPGPGEISLAHHGVLFLDELPEFKRSVLEVLRQPLEDHRVTISRSAGRVTLPASFMLVAAMNPSPCGYADDPDHASQSSSREIQRYRARLSGPLLDRIDLHVEAPALSIQDLRNSRPGEASSAIRERVERARAIQSERFAGEPFRVNARMEPRHLRRHCELNTELGDLLQSAMEHLKLSARAYDRILKVARTIADLDGADRIAPPHLLEAIQYRGLDRTRVL